MFSRQGLGKFTLMVANVGCVYSLTFVALDRYLNIVHPAHCKISERQQLCLLALGFGLALTMSFPVLVVYTPYVVFIILVVMDDTYLATARCDEVGYLSSHLFQRSYYLIISLNPLVYSAANPVFRRECCRLSGYCPFGKELSDRQSDGSKRPILTSDHIK
nr:hypothetical protein BaRGS_008396 [Batillaria attramentaria]